MKSLFLLTAIELELWQYIALGVGGTFLLIIIGLLIAKSLKVSASLKNRYVEDVKIKNGVRYTKDEAIVDEDGAMKVSFAEKDIVLTRGKEYIVKKGGEIIPGKYTVLTANEEAGEFNMRIAGFVRSVGHNTPIVLAEGDKICSVSHTVILR